ncbi:MAG: T9SS type A sorting domain-containing protein [bacterium]
MKNLLYFFALLLITTSVNAQIASDYWRPTLGPTAGSINGLTVDSLDRLYVSTGGDGVLQSTDHGVHWNGFNKGLRVLPMRDVESSTIEYGTGNPIAYVYGLSQRGEVMRRLFTGTATDDEWHYLPRLLYVKSATDTFWADRLDINQLMTYRAGYIFLATNQFGVLRSKNHGDDFDQPTSLRTPTPDSLVTYMAADRITGDIYAISYSNIFHQSNQLKWTPHLSVSHDSGTTWQRLPSVPPNPVYMQNMVIADDGSILIGYHTNVENEDRVYRSSDHGQTWKSVFQIPIAREKGIDAMIHARKGPDIYLNSHGPTYCSSDYGATWEIRNPEKAGEETFHMVSDTSNVIFQCAIPDGVIRLDSLRGVGSDTMFFMDKYCAVQHMDGGISVNSQGTIFSMSQFNMYRSRDKGQTWYNLPTELDEVQFPYWTIDHHDRLFFGSYFGLFRSTDDGETFDMVIKSNPNGALPADRLNQVVFHGANEKDELFVSSQTDPQGTHADGLPWFVRSRDHGETWTRLNNGQLFGIPSIETINACDFSHSTNTSYDTIYASGNSPLIYRSTNDGDNWEVICRDSAISSINQFLCHPDGSVFRLQSGSGPLSGLYHSVDGGVKWTKVFPPDSLVIADYSPVKPLLLDRRGRVIINTFDFSPGGVVQDSISYSGFYLSTSKDFTEWTNVSSGCIAHDWYANRPLNCSQTTQDFKTGYYYTTTRGRSVFASNKPDFNLPEGVPNHPLALSVSEPKNFPNPFTKHTSITFDIPHSGNVKVTVYDIMGRTIEVLAHRNFIEGTHTLEFSTDVPSGEYMVVLETSAGAISHWMTVTK